MNSKKLYGIAAIILAVGLCVFAAGFALADFDFRNLSTDGPFRDGTYEASAPVSSIIVNDLNAAVRVVPSQDDVIRLTYRESDKVGYQINEGEDGTLTLTKHNKKQWYEYIFRLEFEQFIVTVSLPRDFGGDLSLATGNGTISVEDVALHDLHIDTSNQGIKLNGVTAEGKIDASTKNGKVELSGVNTGENLVLKTSNGKAELKDVRAQEIRVQSSNGKLALKRVTAAGSLEASTYNQGIELDRVSFGGSMRCETKNGSIQGSILGNQADFRIESSTKNGSNNLPEKFGTGEKQLNLFTLNGDIEIDFS